MRATQRRYGQECGTGMEISITGQCYVELHSRNRRITSALARENEFSVSHPRSVPPAVASTPRLVDCREALGSVPSERPKS
ncbi:hypothetical protein K438DRAFT_1854034 [Mycena galopus ATCC 62051]|nr:hypothetical protein K438DRAFT_1854034 [Mycena galopus ATCC 62051]